MNNHFLELRTKTAVAVNHVGYEVAAEKWAVVSLGDQAGFDECFVCTSAGKRVSNMVSLGPECLVSGWQGMRFQEIEFSRFQNEGLFCLCLEREDGSQLTSELFQVRDKLFAPKLVPLILDYFRSQRCAGKYDQADMSIPIFGQSTSGVVDVHGGWYDASGDVSKYLSHLSYTNFMNSQQTPLVVWSLIKCSRVDQLAAQTIVQLIDEAAYGADFLVRMCGPSDAFYMTVFDKWTGDTNQREICSYATQKGQKADDWQAGYRQGGGLSIAALAAVARSGLTGEFSSEDYLRTALRGYEHLEANNIEYLDNGRENIIDDYCALLAAIELFRATGEQSFRQNAQRRANSLMERMSCGHGYSGWFRADADGEYPFAHAADEGMPLLALAEYMTIAGKNEHARIRDTFEKAVRHLLALTCEVPNPFSYPRQLVATLDGPFHAQFFFPHENPSGYWWQGENARLASLAYALRRIAPSLDKDQAQPANRLARRMLDWVLGVNPYHTCMMQGVGRNVAQYGLAKFPNVDGGICNGITSSMTDEADIAFCETEDPYQSWRWGEQWLPHAAWFMLAVGEN